MYYFVYFPGKRRLNDRNNFGSNVQHGGRNAINQAGGHIIGGHNVNIGGGGFTGFGFSKTLPL